MEPMKSKEKWIGKCFIINLKLVFPKVLQDQLMSVATEHCDLGVLNGCIGDLSSVQLTYCVKNSSD